MADDFLCDWDNPYYVAVTKQVRKQVIEPPPGYGGEVVDFTKPVDWRSFNDDHRSFQWWLNSFFFLRHLLDEDVSRPGDPDIALSILRGWVGANPPSAPDSDFAWTGHSTAIRSEQVGCLISLGYDEDWLLKSAEQHGDFLADPEHYEGDWNHGLDQNIGLLSLACAVGREDWKDIAFKRTSAAIAAMVDRQGVSIEQATGYHYYNFKRFTDAKAKFAGCDLPLPEGNRVSKMPAFSAHATMPDGTYTRIGDTLLKPMDIIPGTIAEYAATQGKSGPEPTERFAVYDAGYIFGRSGWGEDRPFDQENHYSLRFGPGRIIHGHNDHTSLTYFSRGQRIIIDGGFHGYAKDEWRRYVQTPYAHNVVSSRDGANFFWNAETELVGQKIAPVWQRFAMQDVPYHKTTRRRDVLFIQEPIEAIVVVDSIIGPRRTYEQAWHFDRSLSAVVDGARTVVSGPDFTMDVHQVWQHDSMRIAKGETGPIRGWAGYEAQNMEPVPTLITSRSGEVVTFLTVFVLRDDEPSVVSQRPFQEGPVRREVIIHSGSETAIVELMADGTMRLADDGRG